MRHLKGKSMALVNIESALRKVLNSLKKAKEGSGLEMLSYKRNRGITILKESHDTFLLRERGYENQVISCTSRELQRHLKAMMKREFPRSRKVRTYVIDNPSEAGIKRKKL